MDIPDFFQLGHSANEFHEILVVALIVKSENNVCSTNIDLFNFQVKKYKMFLPINS